MRLLLFVACLGLAPCFALDSITFHVKPGPETYGGMGKVEGMGVLTLTTVQVAPTYWIKSIAVTVQPEVAYKIKEMVEPCPEDAKRPRTWRYEVTPTHPNAVMLAELNGVIPLCKGEEGTAEPTFKSTVVHADLDVDSDNNTSQASGYDSYAQKSPDGKTEEDQVEESANGVLIPLNTGFHEGGTEGKPAKPVEDYKFPGIVTTDPDLSVAKFDVKGKPGKVTFTFLAGIRMWRGATKEDEIKTGAPFDVATGLFTYWIEGIAPGKGDIVMLFVPTGGVGKIDDRVTYTVVQAQIADEKKNHPAQREHQREGGDPHPPPVGDQAGRFHRLGLEVDPRRQGDQDLRARRRRGPRA